MNKSEYLENITKQLDYSYWNFLFALRQYYEIASFPIEKIETSALYRKLQKCFPNIKDFIFVRPSNSKKKWFMTLEPSLEWQKEGRKNGCVLDGCRPLLNDSYTFAVKAEPTAMFSKSDIMIDSNVAMNYTGKQGDFCVLDSSIQYKNMMLFLQIFSMYYGVHLSFRKGEILDFQKDKDNFNKFFRLCLKYQKQSSAYEYLAFSICPLIENIRRFYVLNNKDFFSKRLDEISDKDQKILWQISKLRDMYFAHNNVHCARYERNFTNISSLLKEDDTDEKFLKELIALKIIPPQEIKPFIQCKTLNNKMIVSHLIHEAQKLLNITNQEESSLVIFPKKVPLHEKQIASMHEGNSTARLVSIYIRESLQMIQYFQEVLKKYGIKKKAVEKVLKDYGLSDDLIEYYKNSPFFWRNESLHACFTPEKIIGIEKIDGSETQIELMDLKHYNKICDLVEIVNEFEKMYYLYPQFKKMDLNERNAILLKILSHKKKDERMKILEEFHRHYDKNGIPRLTALKFKDKPLMSKKSTLKNLLVNLSENTPTAHHLFKTADNRKNTLS